MEAPLWERSKENAAPLQRGRNVRTLEESLAMDSDKQAENDRMKQHYERLVKPTEAASADFEDDNDGDPLIHWLSYIKFHQDTCPADKHAQFQLLERCMRSLANRPQYHNDVRFIRVCCMYAEQTDEPSMIFKHMYSQKIGVETALFWMAWGFVAEKAEDYKLAERIYSKGIRKKAQPVEKLVQRHRQFQRRMTRHWLNATTSESELPEEASLDARQKRGALGALSEEAVRRNHRSRASNRNTSTFTIRQDPILSSIGSSNGRSAGAFTIFADNAEESGTLDDSFAAVPRQIEPQQERRKENTRHRETWDNRGVYSSGYAQRRPASSAVRPSPAFSVYVDEECAEEQAREKESQERASRYHQFARDDRTFRDRQEGIADRLSQDPLRYVRDPSQLAADQEAAQPATRRHQGRQRKTGNLVCDISLLKDVKGSEQSFEEARLRQQCFTLAPSRNINLLSTKYIGSTDMNIDCEDSTEENSEALIKSRVFNTSIDLITPRNASTASSTVDERFAVGSAAEPTINTQLAVKELSMMFSSPAVDFRSGGSASQSLEHPLQRQSVAASGDTADVGAIVEVFGGMKCYDENDGPRNPEARSIEHPDFHRAALKPLHEEQASSTPVACSATQRRIGPISQSDPFREAPENELDNDPGFAIFQDDHEDQPDQKCPQSSFSIFKDAPSCATDSRYLARKRKAQTDGEYITIFRDPSPVVQDEEGDTASLSLLEGETGNKQSPIFGNSSSSPTTGDGEGDTASLSLFGDALEVLQGGDDDEEIISNTGSKSND